MSFLRPFSASAVLIASLKTDLRPRRVLETWPCPRSRVLEDCRRPFAASSHRFRVLWRVHEFGHRCGAFNRSLDMRGINQFSELMK